ncbi:MULTISPECIES: conserved phage C-terminal domain-containing protein [unclassified Clostridioides]|uniref:conserved phage C-terminal domain-containing protein n=1 Tax=unclassified Clostridioides TaxID=2635829 RepID=UPI001D105A48|nr:conserved phage C-terminal domain-containing protein [Clostridioides sp. ES-S-0049-03]MCC0677365.1 conserved phage C-terminal domain-containing protein [Clostridioides sp. ES-W-0018-02]MCC0694545.1 conserved phage C-terminal domain-containing protein [Clostridioides sp. ES-S-0048-02]MCC0702721.1 conserved phage C-terminal domain-containing protein [Clostridioides sp. ES-S-0049-02]MCC0712513.1 conserved phage C-terminal domain-containing protein [Clostridioides sp. ES-W-0017-02]
MNNGFYQLNSAVLYFNERSDVNKIRFNHYIMRKENIQRLRGTLPRGQFMMTVRKAASDLDLSISTISRLVNEFIDLGILRLISRGVKGNCCSVYSYICSESNDTGVIKKRRSFFEDILENINETNNSSQKVSKHEYKYDKDKTSDTNMYSYVDKEYRQWGYDPELHTVDETEDVTKKKELLKKNLKKELLKKNSKKNTDVEEEYCYIESIYENIIKKLNKESGESFRFDSETDNKLIAERRKEGHSLEDFYKVIESRVKSWKETPTLVDIKPEILFGHEFKTYLNKK